MDRLGGLEHPFEHLSQALDAVTWRVEITPSVFNSTLQDVQTIFEFVELDARDDEFVL